MNGKSLLMIMGLLFSITMQAQEDVTAKYFTDAGFESFETGTVIDGVVQLISNEKTAVDYQDKGWTFSGGYDGSSSYNAGVTTYPVKVKYSKWLNGLDGPSAGPSVEEENTKALCFTGNKSVLYKQSEEITLPAGKYTFSIAVWAYNGGTTNPSPTVDVKVGTGFITSDGTEYLSEKKLFKSSEWDRDVIEMELPHATKGKFQLTYGSSYFVAIDNLKLMYEGGVITTSLSNAISKATTLNAKLNSSDLATAITAAETFLANPTTQEEVGEQVETLYTAMGTALQASAEAVDITDVYLENASFETGKIDPWEWKSTVGMVGTPINEDSAPYIDGKNIVEFTNAGSNGLTQTLSHMPTGHYMMDAKLNQKVSLTLGDASTACQGGSNAFYLRVHTTAFNQTAAGELKVGASATTSFRIDNFRLFYCSDETKLIPAIYPAVVADAKSVLAEEQYAVVTGAERKALSDALENGTDLEAMMTAINKAANAFVAAKDSYQKYASAQKKAAEYTVGNYPYADATVLEQIQTLINTPATSATHATTLKDELDAAMRKCYVSHFYCEGVEGKTDYTEKIAGANATGTTLNSAWTCSGMEIRSDKAPWVNPKTDKEDKEVYGVTLTYYRTSKDAISYMQQSLSGLPAGKYFFSVIVMAGNNVTPIVKVNGSEIGTLHGTGTAVYGTGWVENGITFDKADDQTMILRLEYTGTANYQQWFFDNLRLYQLPTESDGIEDMNRVTITTNHYYDLQGRQVAKPVKGLYVVNGKKVVVK